MEKWKRRSIGRRRSLRRKARAIAVLVFTFLLAGCSRERTETRREIERIQKAAEIVAEERAAAYILEKYGMKAIAEGHWVQAYNDFFAPYVSTNVIVFMEYRGSKFCVGIDVDDEAVLWDNYQREEIEEVFQDYFAELYKLPAPYRAKTEFRLENAPDYLAATPAEWRERGYDHGSMADLSMGRQRKSCLRR